MKPMITAYRDDGKTFHAFSKKIADRIRANERRSGQRVTAFMVEMWLAGKEFDGMMLSGDIPYSVIAEKQELFPQVVIELPNS